MRKPRNYDTTEVFGTYEPIPAGNYKMSIYKVEESKSKKGNPMLIVWLDIAEGEYRGRIFNEYKNDTRSPRDWNMKFYVSMEDDNGNCHKALKTFINAVEKSNRHFDESVIWGEEFTTYFEHCVVGGAIRREEYLNQKGERKWSSKVSAVFPVEEIETRAVPNDKPLAEDKPAMPSYMNNARPTGGFNAGDGFSSRRSYAGYDDEDRREPSYF